MDMEFNTWSSKVTKDLGFDQASPEDHHLRSLWAHTQPFETIEQSDTKSQLGSAKRIF